jgi:alkylhydroperoxidase family enzyme
MAYIREIPPARAGGRLAQVYGEIRGEVPRVPSFLQVFSLRPETMEGMYRNWVAIMWNGSTARQTKELVSVAVHKAVRCEYGVDAGLVALQAAGASRDKCYQVESSLGEAEALAPEERELLRFAVRVSTEPRALQSADRMLLARAWPDIEARVELLSTIAGTNAMARLANSLGVGPEIPPGVRRFEPARRGAIAMLSRLMALSLEPGERSLPARPPEENLKALADIFGRQLGFGAPPAGLELLDARPEVFDGQLRLLEKSIAVLPRDRWMRSGLVVGRLTGCDFLSMNCSEWLAMKGERPTDVIAASEGSDTKLPEAEKASLRFVRDFSLHSHTIGVARIDELHRAGLSDGAVLDLAFVAGIFNALSRLIISLAPF